MSSTTVETRGDAAAGRLASAGSAHARAARALAGPGARRDVMVRCALAGADAAALVLALVCAFAVRDGGSADLAWSLTTVPTWLAICAGHGLYRRDAVWIGHGIVDDLGALLHSLVLGCLGLWVYLQEVVGAAVDGGSLALFAACLLVFTLGMRSVARRAARRRLGPQPAALIGRDADLMRTLARKLQDHPEYGIQTSWMGSPTAVELGTLEAQGVERLIVTDGVDDERVSELARQAQELGLKVSIVARPLDLVGPAVAVDQVEGITVFGIAAGVPSRAALALKRAIDLVGALAMLILCTPLLVLIALAVKLDSRGPVLYRQRRVGRDGRPFLTVKIRTMVTDADRMVDALRAQSQDPDWLMLDHDPRVTRVGRLLRRTSLDELPQAWNVLKGEMSLVGPRPLIESEDRRVGERGRRRSDLAPGMTGPWQVLGRTRIPFSEMVSLDCGYVTDWSLSRDFKLLLSTVGAVLTRRGAN